MASISDKIWLPIQVTYKSTSQEEDMWTTPVSKALNERPVFDPAIGNLGLFHIEDFTDTGAIQIIENGVTYLTMLLEEAEAEMHLRPMWQILVDFKVFYREMRELLMYLTDHQPLKGLIPFVENSFEELISLNRQLQFNTAIYKYLLLDGTPEKHTEAVIRLKYLMEYEKLGLVTAEIEEVTNLVDKYTEILDLIEKLKPENVCCAEKTDDDEIQAEFVAYNTYSEEQQTSLISLLEARHDLANMLGFSCYSEKMLAGTPFSKIDDIDVFINSVSDGIRELTAKDFRIMASLKRRLNQDSELCFSDVHNLLEVVQNSVISDPKLLGTTPYLTLGGCVEAMSTILKKIFFISFDMSLPLSDEVFSEDIYKLQVIHSCHGVICYLFLDLMKREGKPEKTRYYILREGKFEEDSKDLLSRIRWRPIRVVLTMNLEPSDYPLHLTISEAETLFLEIGKLLPKLLIHSRYQHALRYPCCIDFNFISSHIMKKLFYDVRVMPLIFKDYQEETSIEPELAQKISLSRKVFHPSQMQMLVLKSAIDYACHKGLNTESTLSDIFMAEGKKHYGLNEDYFSHRNERYLYDEKLSGMFYRELLMRAALVRVWDRFYKDDPLNSESSDAFCNLMIECFHITDPEKCFAHLMDMEITPENLASILVNDIKENFQESFVLFEKLKNI